MDKKEIEKLKKELREEIRKEIETSLEKNRNTSVWHDYVVASIKPLLDEKIENSKEKYNLMTALNTIARVHAKKKHVYKLTEQDLETIKPIVTRIIEEF